MAELSLADLGKMLSAIQVGASNDGPIGTLAGLGQLNENVGYGSAQKPSYGALLPLAGGMSIGGAYSQDRQPGLRPDWAAVLRYRKDF